MAANNGPYQVYPGQNFEGAKVETAQQIFGKKVITTGGLAAGGNVPTIAILSGAGTVGTITQQNGYDQAGNFILTAGSASIFGGSLASVTFGSPLSATPVAVNVSAGYTSGTTSLAVGAVSVSKTGFVIQGGAPASAAAYLMSYQVIKSPF
jgi:hypothetical protein